MWQVLMRMTWFCVLLRYLGIHMDEIQKARKRMGYNPRLSASPLQDSKYVQHRAFGLCYWELLAMKAKLCTISHVITCRVDSQFLTAPALQFNKIV